MIVALDVDGTLYDGTHVDPAAVEAVTAAAANGHHIMIVTGRVWTDLPQIIPELLPHVTAAVCEHGTIIVTPKSGDLQQLAPPLSTELVDAVAATGWRPVVIGQATIGLPAEAHEVALAICHTHPRYRIEDNKASVAIVPVGFDKGRGLLATIDQFELDGESILAVGDALNDIPMMAVADVGVAVANAERGLIAHVTEVTRDPFGAGVADALGRHLGLSSR